MADLPHPWDIYAQIQSKLATLDCVNSASWGLEAGLDHICGLSGNPNDLSATGKAIASASRRERNRRNLLAKSAGMGLVDPVVSLEVASDLDFVSRHLKPYDFELLISIAGGETYQELSVSKGIRADALRAKVSRTRRLMASLICEEGAMPVAA